MRAILNKIRAFLRGPSDDELDRDLAALQRDLERQEAEFNAERERFIRDHPRMAWLYPPAIKRRGLEG